jgi:tetratricopeptide (TPR) repeat protein
MASGNIAINDLEQLAEAAHSQRNFGQAKSLRICLIGFLKQEFGEVSEQLAVNFYKLGEVYADEGNYEAARTMYHRATEIWAQLPRAESIAVTDAMIELHRLSDLRSKQLKGFERGQSYDAA